MPLPITFVSHGAPTLATDLALAAPLRAWGQQLALTKPRAIAVVSAHWASRERATGAESTLPLYYDFAGFPDELYRLSYAAPGSPEVAARLRALTGSAAKPERPWDHGVWVPLLHLFPKADVPVVQVTLPLTEGPDGWLALGRALAPLADEGVLILGSGGMVHNLGRLRWGAPGAAKPEAWAAGFDGWVAQALLDGRVDEVAHAVRLVPDGEIAHPTVEHFAPLVVAAGAASARGTWPKVTFPMTGFAFGNLSMRAVQFG